MGKLKEGFYYLKSSNETEPTLVHGYHCTDLDGAFVFGFNTHDGGGRVRASDFTEDTEVVPVEIVESSRMKELEEIYKLHSNAEVYADRFRF